MTQEIWARVEKAVNDVVDGITLADLVDRYQQKNGGNYSI